MDLFEIVQQGTIPQKYTSDLFLGVLTDSRTGITMIQVSFCEGFNIHGCIKLHPDLKYLSDNFGLSL